MSLFIVYFHDFESDIKDQRHKQITDKFPDSFVFGFDADVDPEVAFTIVGNHVIGKRLETVDMPVPALFIGEGLGAWLASKLGWFFDVDAVMVNPLYDPYTQLEGFGVDPETLEKYSPIEPRPAKDVYFLGKSDIADLKDFKQGLRCESYDIDDYHQFTEKSFGDVLEYVRIKYNQRKVN